MAKAKEKTMKTDKLFYTPVEALGGRIGDQSIDIYGGYGTDNPNPYILKFAKMITDRMFVRITGRDPDYYGIATFMDEDMAKIGLLCLNKGFYNGKQIVSSGWIEEMTKPKAVESKYFRGMEYGYLWWIYPKDTTIKIIRKEYNTGKYDSYCANGVGSSLVAVIPELDAVISMTCSLVYNPKPRMELINNYIIPYLESI